MKKYYQDRGVKLFTFSFGLEDREAQGRLFREEVFDTVYGEKQQKFFTQGATHERSGLRASGRIIHRGILKLIDFHSEKQNISEGLRYTIPNKLEGYSHTSHFFGASEIFGTHLEDHGTIPSQYSIFVGTVGERVLNHAAAGVNFIDVVARMLSTHIASGDTVFLVLPFAAAACSDLVVDLQGEALFDSSHVTPIGAEVVARSLWEAQAEAGEAVPLPVPKDYQIADKLAEIYRGILIRVEAEEYNSEEIAEYRGYLAAARFTEFAPEAPIIGSVAVNCNPITKGHLALLEFARSQVDYLYILVIEEDKSAVSFDDRLKMVEAACAHWPNVKILRGGQFVCTEYIAPEYFDKDAVDQVGGDFHLESFYFGTFIAPELGITKIFLGEEPICKVTRAYNAHMQIAMPHYGIDLTIIPRIAAADGNPISASRVRAFAKEGNWQAVQQLMPEAAYEYMREQVKL
ncbi:MAG: hypothetical protein ACSHWZ_16385 [Sulfitobacter sp.]